MNFQRFLRSSALLGVLGSVFLNTSSYGMEDPADPEDGARGLASRTAALSVSAPEVLVSDVSEEFLQKIMGLPKIYGTRPDQFPINLKVKFVPILGKEEDKIGLQALFGDKDEGRAKVSQILAEQIAAMKECIRTKTLGNLKWLYLVSHSNESFEPAGYFETQGHEDYKLTEGSLPSERRDFFNSRGSCINTFCFEDFHRKIRKKFPLPSVKDTVPPHRTMWEAVADKPLIDAFVAHFDFHGFQDPTNATISYQPSLLGVGGQTDSSDLEDLGVRCMTLGARGVHPVVALQNSANCDVMMSDQLKALNSFRYRMHEPMNLDKTTFLLRRSTDSCVVGLLKFKESKLQLQMDPSFSRPIAEQMLRSFVDGEFVGTGFGLRRLRSATAFFEQQEWTQLHFAWKYLE
ncbi:MAG: hypothetical protein B7Y25_07800 [Alphaproteobacteria bacterium 16-39-46]|nr:MAG: hypothetical protein B7Y25_07800 [Alphaproteobacteria bacterium 16-39-46]OZA41449.1 MAG: hypothetical protein B7X84_07950 [Alphaproteobacteria bacterium 17-39-52]HQS84804.1 hypothetical protein [Alphaproteobacteria bacterium]HQS94601.1 hypothetical protein [Alphaproteobacteria bacterium]